MAASIHEGHCAAFSDIASLQFVVERAAGNISESPVADFFDCDRPVEAAAGDFTLSISDSHRAVIASAGDRNTGGIHPAGVFHSQVRIEKGNVANGQRTTFHIQGIILCDGNVVQYQVAADARRLFQVFHVGDGKPAVVDQCAVHRQRSILSQRQQAGNCVFASGLGRYGTALIDCQKRLIAYLATRAHGQAAVDHYAFVRIETHDTFQTIQRQRPVFRDGQRKIEM